MNTKTLGLGFVVALLAVGAGALGGTTFSKPVVVQKIVERVVEERLGASPGPVRFNDCESRNGVEQCFRSSSLVVATTTPCALQSPRHASSTLVRAAIQFTTSTSSEAIIHLAKASGPNSTTTSLGSRIIAAGYQGALHASTTPSGAVGAGAGGTSLNNDFVFAAGQWFTVGMQQTGAGGQFVVGLAPVGSCKATFETF